MKWDGFAFPAPDIRESEHAAPQCKPRSISPAEPETVVNAISAGREVSESSTRRSPGSPPYSNAPWTFQDEATLRRMWTAGGTDDEIADALGRSRSAIASRRMLLGIGKKHRI